MSKIDISAKVIKASRNPQGVDLITMEVDLHRFVLAELSKHRVFSMSASSSRAIPVKKMVEMVRTNPAMPRFWGKNQPGMQSNDECNTPVGATATPREDAWKGEALAASYAAEDFSNAGYHKQIVNRLLEPFMWQKCVITATEWDNFWHLRLHKDAQPEIRLLAEAMLDAWTDTARNNQVQYLEPGQWHLPYVTSDMSWMTLEQKIKYSAASCASKSYRTEHLTEEKAFDIFDKLVLSEPWHSVPLEHQATPLAGSYEELGYTHTDRHGNLWSGNFRDWAQYRQIWEQQKEVL